MIKNFLNPKVHQNPFSGLKVTPILLKVWIWPIGGGSIRPIGGGSALQPAQQGCFFVVGSLQKPLHRQLAEVIKICLTIIGGVED